MAKKRWFYISLFASLLLGAFALKPLSHLTAKLLIQSAVKKKIGEPISFNSIEFSSKKIRILSPKIGYLNSKYLSRSVLFSAESLQVNYGFNWKQKQLTLEVELQKPHLTLLESRESIETFKRWFQPSSSSNWIRWNLKSEGGELVWIQPKQKQKFSFIVESHQLDESQQLTRLNFKQNDNELKVLVHQSADERLIKFKIPHMSSDLFLEFLNFYRTVKQQKNIQWYKKEGFLQAELTACLTEKKAPSIQLNIQAKNTCLQQTEKHPCLIFPEIDYELESSVLGLPSTYETIKSPFENFFKNARGSFTLAKGSKCILPNTPSSKEQEILLHASVDFYRQRPTKVCLEGTCFLDQKKTAFSLGGMGFFSQKRGDFELLVDPLDGPLSKVQLSFQPHLQSAVRLQSQLENISADLWMLVQSLYPQKAKPIIFSKGLLNAQLDCLFDAQSLLEVNVPNLALEEVTLESPKKYGKIQGLNLKGSLSCPKIYQMAFNEASFVMNMDLEQWTKKSHIYAQNFNAKMALDKGELKVAHLNGALEGAEITLDWDINSSEYPLAIQWIGALDFPAVTNLLNRFDYAHLKNVPFAALLKAKKQGEKWSVFFNGELEREDTFNFYTDLQTLWPKSLWSFLHSKQDVKDILSNVWAELGFQNAFFESKNLDAKTYFDPFISSYIPLNVEGITDIKGEISNDKLCIECSNYQLQLEHPDVHIELNYDDSLTKCLFDFKNQHFEFLCPLQSSSCYVKEPDLLFEQLQGDATFTKEGLKIPVLEGLSCGILMQANMHIQFHSAIEMDLYLTRLKSQSTLEHFGDFFSAFNLQTLSHIPIVGAVEITPQNSTFHLHRGEESHYSLHVNGKVSKGHLKSSFSNITVNEVSSDFIFDSQKQILQLSQLEANIPTSSSAFKAHCRDFKIHFKEPIPTIFDLRVKNRFNDLAVIKGEFLFNPSKDFEDFELNFYPEMSRLGPFVFNQAQISYEKGILARAHIDFKTRLPALLKETTLFNDFNSALFAWLKRSDFIEDVTGPLEGQWSYLNSKNQHKISLFSDRLNKRGERMKPLQLEATVEEGYFDLRELSLEPYKLSLKGESQQGQYYFKDIRFQKKGAIYLNCSGYLDKNEPKFLAQVHKFNGQMYELLKLGSLSAIESKGKIDLKGQIHAYKENNYWKGDLQLKGSSEKISLEGLELQSGPIEIELEKDEKGLFISSFKASVDSLLGRKCSANILAKELRWAEELKNCYLGKVHFEYPQKQLSEINEWLKALGLSRLIGDIRDFKQKGPIRGAFSYHPQETEFPINFELEGGEYFFRGHPFHMDAIKFNSNETNQIFSFKTHLNQYPFWIEIHQDKLLENSLFLTLYEKDPLLDASHESANLTVKSKLNSKNDLYIESFYGSLSGIYMDWVNEQKDPENSLACFKGQMQIKSSDAYEKLPAFLRKGIQSLKMGAGYFLSGSLNLDTHHPELFKFKGIMGGHNFALLGYQFKSLSSEISFDKQQILFSDIKLSDVAGEMGIPSIELKNIKNEIYLDIPKLLVHNLKPSLLRKIGQTQYTHKPLNIERLELKGLKGNLNDLDSLSGNGYLKFVKSTKKAVTLLDVPVHLIAKLGLDLKMLDPVEGKIFYEIKNQKIQLLRFLDVYSQDRHCHFQVMRNLEGSYIDFLGHIDIRIKMKQFVLLKLTEPYVISIGGDITRPKYSFKRRKMKVDVPEKIAP